MESGNKSRYVLTLWPEEIAPPVLFAPKGASLTSEGYLEYDWDGDWRKGSLPSELYLRGFWDLDLDDDEAIAGFEAAHGRFTRNNWAELPLDLLMDTPSDVDAVLTRHLPPGYDLRGRLFSHVDEFRVHARALRDAIRLGWAYKSQLSYRDAIDQWESRVYPVTWASGDPERHLELDCLSRLDDVLGAALSAFHVRMDVHVVKAVKGDEVDSWKSSFDPFPSVYAALCLQLATDLAGSTPYRRCEFVDCGRLFIRKQGRAKFRHRTRGVLRFCSDSCANRDAQRKHRKKIRDKAAQADNPGPSRESGQDSSTDRKEKP